MGVSNHLLYKMNKKRCVKNWRKQSENTSRNKRIAHGKSEKHMIKSIHINHENECLKEWAYEKE